MKTLSAITLILALSVNINAQIQKGAILVGGDVSFSGNNEERENLSGSFQGTDEFKNHNLTLRPQVGLFSSASLLLGVGISYERRFSERESTLATAPSITDRRVSNIVLLNPYITKFHSISDKFYFTTTFNLLVGAGATKFGQDEEAKSNTFYLRANITPGLDYFISDSWAISASIGNFFYNFQKLSTEEGNDIIGDSESRRHAYGLSFDFNSFFVGFKYFLRNKGEE